MDEKDIIIHGLKSHIKNLEKVIESQSVRIAELERRVELDSSTSSKPPSSDGLRKKPVPQNLRDKSSKKSGGQKGHTLAQVDHSDMVVEHIPTQCSRCQNSLEAIDPSCWITRQVLDIPEPKIQVTEHRVGVKVCSCGEHVQGKFPEGVRAPIQYGPRLQAVSCYFLHQQLIPEDRLVDLLKDIFQIDITAATLVNMAKKLEKRLSSWTDRVKETLQRAPVKNLDETGFRIGSKTSWLHTQSTPEETYYRPSAKRGEIPTGLVGICVVLSHL